MKVLVTGAGGPIGKRTVQTFIDNFEASELELIVAIDNDDVSPWFIPDETKIWIEDDISNVSPGWWESIVEQYDITRIVYLESSENFNSYVLDANQLNTIRNSDEIFTNYVSDTTITPEIIFMSTDGVYADDEYPDELDNIILPNFSSSMDDTKKQLNKYSLNKLSSELDLITDANSSNSLRIIRPFSIVSSEQGTDYPLSDSILRAIRGTDLESYSNGDRGLCFTSASDLAYFLTHNLFDPQITLTSNIINFARTKNYLPENYLLEKIKNKTESSSIINYGSLQDNFMNIKRTPRTENADKYYTPQVTIESIIEEISYSVDPVDKYAPVEITSSTYDSNKFLTVVGTSEPMATISIQLGSGDTLVADANETGYWITTSAYPINYNEVMDGQVYATTPEKVQYSTLAFTIEP